MKKKVYDFSIAVEHINEWDSPSVMSYELKDAALTLATLKDDGSGVIKEMQCVALGVCRFLDCIIERVVEQ